jgi:hypothetical protein
MAKENNEFAPDVGFELTKGLVADTKLMLAGVMWVEQALGKPFIEIGLTGMVGEYAGIAAALIAQRNPDMTFEQALKKVENWMRKAEIGQIEKLIDLTKDVFEIKNLKRPRLPRKVRRQAGQKSSTN